MTVEIPEGAFATAGEHTSMDWQNWFPGHCYICHIAMTDTADVPHDQVYREDQDVMTCLAGCRGCAAEEDTSKCGPHCDSGGSQAA